MSDRVTNKIKISYFGKSKLLSNEAEVTQTFSDFLENAVNKLSINEDDTKFNDKPALLTNRVDKALQNFDSYPSVKLNRDNIVLSDMF